MSKIIIVHRLHECPWNVNGCCKLKIENDYLCGINPNSTVFPDHCPLTDIEMFIEGIDHANNN